MASAVRRLLVEGGAGRAGLHLRRRVESAQETLTTQEEPLRGPRSLVWGAAECPHPSMRLHRSLLLALVASTGACAPSARMAAPGAEVPVLVGRPPAAGERVKLSVGRAPRVERDTNVLEIEAVERPSDEERLDRRLRSVLRGCPECVVYVPWLEARLRWFPLLRDETSALGSNAVVVGQRRGEGEQ